MKSSLQSKLTALVARYQEIAITLSDPAVISDQQRFRELSKEYAQLEPIITCFEQYQNLMQSIEQNQQLLNDADPDMRELAETEIAEAKIALEKIEKEIHVLLIPEDPDDQKNIYLEIRGGAGGDEAAIFAGDLFRMYSRYAEHQGWRVEIINVHAGEHGGFKEVIAKISGHAVYSHLKFESGAHRVQRVPATEAQGRIHTSTCTVAVLPEAEAIDAITVSPDEIRVDTYRSSGAGGQHVNVTDSAVRITHLPTGIVVECQDERSQHKNRAKAMALLQSRILAEQQRKQREERDATRRSLVGTGDRSERIRTYNFPQGRLTDHRINLTLYQLTNILEGELTPVIQPLREEYQADQLTALGLEDNAS